MKNNEHEKSLSLRSVFHLCLRYFTLAILATIALSGCGSGGDGGGGGQTTASTDTAIVASGVVTSAGGVVADQSEKTLVVVPPGAVVENTTITIRQGVSADGYPITTFESSAPTGPVQVILPDPESPVVGGVSSVAGILTAPIDKGAATQFGCGVDRSKDWYRRCAWFWKPNMYVNGAYVAGVGNRLSDRVVDMKLSPELKEAVLRQAVFLASECEFMPYADSLCYAGKEPVLFVHGYMSTTSGENGFGGGGDTWGDFPNQLRAAITTKQISLFEFRWVTAARFQDVAQDLGVAIDQIAARTGRKVHVVAHSFGGVLVRTYLQGHAANGYPYNGNVASLTTLGSPYSGIFDDITVRRNITYQRGADSFSGTTQTNICKQLSCYQAGELIDFGEESYFGAANLDHKQVLAVEPEPGEIAELLFETRNRLPEVPIQVLIGLTAGNPLTGTFFVGDGDCLISYAGQRFAPYLMSFSTDGQPLLNVQKYGAASVTEHMLGFDDSVRPGAINPLGLLDPEIYGYRHTNVPGVCGGWVYPPISMAAVDSDNVGYHDGLARAREWIAMNASEPSTTPVSLEVTGRIVDKQTGRPLLGAKVTLRPWYVTDTTVSDGRFRILLSQVTPVDNIEIVASMGGYQQGFQTALGAENGGLVSLPDLGLIKTGSADLNAVVLQKLVKLEIRTAGDGFGTVSGHDIGCPAKCSVWVSAGSTVALRAVAQRDSQFSGWSGCTPKGAEACEATVGAGGTVVTATFSKLVIPLPSEPLPPSTPAATVLSQSNIAFTWQDNADNESGFEVERKLGLDGTYTRIAQPGLSSGTGSGVYFEDTGLVVGTQYCYRVRALNAGGYSSYTADRCVTTQAVGTAPSAPTGINATAGNGQATISWNAVSGITYNLYMASVSGVTKSTYSGLPDGMKHSGVTSPYVHTGLTNGKTYYFAVTAVNANGESGESSQVSTTPQATSIKVWGTPQLIETGNTPTSSPKIAMDANGNAIAVWHQSTLNGAGYINSVYANRYTTGTGWGSETIIGGNSTQYGGTPSSNNVDPPRIAITGDGTAIALWIQRDASSFNTSSACYANRYVPGQGWGTAQMVVPNVSSIASIQVAADATGNAIAVCPQYVGASQSIYAARYTVGQGWGAALQISSTGIPSSSGAYEPHIAIDSNGNAISVWAQWDGVTHNLYTNRYNAGLGWETAQLLQTGTGFEFSWGSGNSPNIAIDSSGNAMVVWGQYNGGYRIFSKRYTVGQGWGAAQIIDASAADPNNNYAYRPQIAMDNNGNAIAVWEQPLSSNPNNVWSNRYVAGQGWGTAVAIENSAYSGVAINAQIAMSANGDAVVVWHKVGDMWANRFVAGQGWGTAGVIETSTAAARDPQVVIDASGYAIAVWRQYDGVTDSIWTNRLQDSSIPQCSDGIDNDGDGKIDLADPGCSSAQDNSEFNISFGEF